MSVRHEQQNAATTTLAVARTALARWLAQPDVRAALIATAGFRLLCSGLAAAPFLLRLAALPHAGPIAYLTDPWFHWDTTWYVGIAQHGYGGYGSTFFMPLYPLLIRATAPLVGGDYVAAALVVSTITAFFALQALYRLAARFHTGERGRALTLQVALLLPTAFILMAGYTESLFLALSLWAILAALDERWGRMAILGGLAALTRQQGMLLAALALPPAWNWLRRRGPLPGVRIAGVPGSGDVPKRIGAALLAGTVPLLAYGGWIACIALVLRAPLPWNLLAASNAWNLRFTWPGSGLLADMALLIHPAPDLMGMRASAALDVSMSVGALAALLLALRRFPPGLWLYLAAMWCSAQIKVLPNGLTIAEGRYMLGLLPLCIIPAAWLARGGPVRRVAWAVIGTCSLTLFLWIFIFGGWTP